MVMNKAYILLGSNEGNRLEYLSRALDLIQQEAGKMLLQSGIYETVAWGNPDQPDFLNQVICIDTTLDPLSLLKKLLDIEKMMGRSRNGSKWMQRIIDLDILFYEDRVVKEKDLCIPHPFIQDRKFVLLPLKEIASGLVHPVLKKDIATLAGVCKDMLEVRKLPLVP